MKNAIYAALFVLGACLTPSAPAQGMFTRTTPPTRPFSTDPRIGVYYGQQPGGIGLLLQPNLGLGGAFAQQSLTMQPTGQQSQQVGAALTDLGSPNQTGHATAFASYSQYFSSQGGGGDGSGAPSSTPASRTSPSATLAGAVGGQPSTTPGSRSKSSTTGPTRQPRR